VVIFTKGQILKPSALLLMALLWAGALQAEVIARVDKNPVLVNESFNLILTSDQSLSGDAFDRSDLFALFKVGRTSVSRQTRIVNGESSQSTVWTTLLQADKTGEYIIPALNVGGEKTSAISVKVVEGQVEGHPSRDGAELFLTTTLSSDEVYLGQQIILDVKLYYANALQRGSLSEPKIDNADIAQVGEDKEASELVNGKRYRVIIRKYRIQPKASGEFRLGSPFFEGEVATSNNNSIFQGFSTGKAVSTRGQDHLILVHPIPENYLGYWLPSESVTIEESWQIPDSIKAGEPITRKISLVALGVSEQQLPRLNLPGTEKFAVYPDQAERITGELNGLPAAKLSQSFAFIANQAGDIEIPEVKIPWWDTKTKVQRWASLPARTIHIGDIPKGTGLSDQGQGTSSPVQTQQRMTPDSTNWIQWLFLGLWLLTALGWWFTAKNNRNSRITSEHKATDQVSSTAWKNLKAACEMNDGPRILSCLLIWSNELASTEPVGNNQSNRIENISAIKDYFGLPELNQQLDWLQAGLYGTSTNPWSGKTILALLKTPASSVKKKGLPALN